MSETEARIEQKREWERRNATDRTLNLRAKRQAWAWLREANLPLFAALYDAEPRETDLGERIHRQRRYDRACSKLVKCVPKDEWLLLYEQAKAEVRAEDGE